MWCFNFLKSLCPFVGRKRRHNRQGLEEYKEGKNIDDSESLDAAQAERKGRYLLGFLGTIFVALSSVFYFFDPVEIIIKKSIHLGDGNIAFRIWRRPPVPAQLKIYIFNFTNSEAFLKGEENLKVTEIGPYVFNVYLENQNITFNNNNTVSYVPVRTVFEYPEKTKGDLKKDTVIAMNVPFLGVGSYVANSSFVMKMAFTSLMTLMDTKPFLKMSVEEYLWGYEDTLIKHANKFLPTVFNFEKLGYMDRIFDEGLNLVTMNLNAEPEVRSGGKLIRPLSLDRFNGEAGLQYYGYDSDDVITHRSCNTLEGVTWDGVLFPRKFPKTASFLIYRKIFCRSMPLVFDRTGISERGLPGYWYKFPEDAFDNNKTENTCYCRNTCYPSGLSEISSCYWNMPVAASYPHFLHMDKSLLKTVDGLNPTVEDHGSSVLIQQDLGLMMKADTRVQVNLVMGDMSFNPRLKRFKGMVLPILWANYCLEDLPLFLIALAYTLVFVLPIMQSCCIILFAVGGVVLLTAFFVRTIYETDENHRRKDEEERQVITRYEKLNIIPVVKTDI